MKTLSPRHQWRYAYTTLRILAAFSLASVLLLAACAQAVAPTHAPQPSRSPTAPGAASFGHQGETLYTDAKLGFRLWLPSGWVAQPQPGRFSSARNTSAPEPGDLLIFQDVNDPTVGWRSGLINEPGHVALIVSVDATHVYVAQENFSDSAYFLALPLTHTANGYHVTDLSDLPNRITRGWIHFALDPFAAH